MDMDEIPVEIAATASDVEGSLMESDMIPVVAVVEPVDREGALMKLDMIPVVADVEPVDTEVMVGHAMAPVDTEEESAAFERADLENVDLSEVNMDEKPADLGMSADLEGIPADADEMPVGAVI